MSNFNEIKDVNGKLCINPFAIILFCRLVNNHRLHYFFAKDIICNFMNMYEFTYIHIYMNILNINSDPDNAY